MGESNHRISAVGRRIAVSDPISGREWVTRSPAAVLRRGGEDRVPGTEVRGSRMVLHQEGDVITGDLSLETGSGALTVPLTTRTARWGIEFSAGPVTGLGPGERFEVEYPSRFGAIYAGHDGYLVIPLGMGVMCGSSPGRGSRIMERDIYSGGQTGLTMPVFGTVSGKEGLAGIVDTPYDCRIRIEINRGRKGTYSLSPVWVFDSRTNYERRVVYDTVQGGYVQVAKLYRERLASTGLLVSLKSKASGNPEVEMTVGSLLGHRSLEYKEPEDSDSVDENNAYGFFRKAQREGFDRVIAHNVERGEPREMAAAAEFARSLGPGYRLSVYENFLDIFRTGEQPERPGSKIYPDWEESLIVRERDGSMRPNWRFRRKGAPDIWTYTVCPARRLEVALPQLEALKAILGRGSIYIDVEGAVPLFECFDGRHPVTRSDDARLRKDLLKEVKRFFGVVTTEALPQDFLAPWVEVGSYFSVFPHSGYGNSEFRIMPPLVPIPLHPLVWHGALLNQTGTGTNFYQSDPPHAALFGWLADTMDDKGRRIAYKLRHCAHAEMLGHEFLTGPRVIIGPDDAFHCDDVQLTRFSDGTIVVGNFASIPYEWHGRMIGSMDFLVFNERLRLSLECPRRIRCDEELDLAIFLENTWDRPIPESVLSLYTRGIGHSGDAEIREKCERIDVGATVSKRVTMQAPSESGRYWVIAVVGVQGKESFSVTELCSYEIS